VKYISHLSRVHILTPSVGKTNLNVAASLSVSYVLGATIDFYHNIVSYLLGSLSSCSDFIFTKNRGNNREGAVGCNC
jgi:hypothetical protein